MFIIQIGFAITFLSQFSNKDDYQTLGQSMLTLYSAMLGNFEFDFPSDSDFLSIAGKIALVLYSVITAIVLLNLLIAQMSNTYKRIEDASLQEWLFAKSSTVMRFLTVVESNPFCMLPAPLNLITIVVAPLDYFIFSSRRVSITRTVANFLLEYMTISIGCICICVEICYFQSYEFEMDMYSLCRLWKKYKYWTLIILILLPLGALLVVAVVLCLVSLLLVSHFFYFGFKTRAVNLTADGRIKFEGIEVEDLGIAIENDAKGDNSKVEVKRELKSFFDKFFIRQF